MFILWLESHISVGASQRSMSRENDQKHTSFHPRNFIDMLTTLRRKKWSFTVQRCKKLYGVLQTSCQAESACQQKIKRKTTKLACTQNTHKGKMTKTTETLVSL